MVTDNLKAAELNIKRAGFELRDLPRHYRDNNELMIKKTFLTTISYLEQAKQSIDSEINELKLRLRPLKKIKL